MSILYLVDVNTDEIEKQNPPLILYNLVYFCIISYTQVYKLYSSMAFEARQSGFYTRLCLF
jgi:hypothetical protein